MKVAIVGAGLIGQSIAHLLGETGDFDVVAFDRDEHALAKLDAQGIATRRVDSADAPALRHALSGFDALVNALPYYLAIGVASAAKAAGVHYFDLTEDVRATHAIRAIADGAQTVFMPQCGLAPGFVGIVAHDLAKRLHTLREVKMRVGALPEFPTNALKYNLTWSIDGLINEYCQPCEAVREGRAQWVQPLEGVEHFSLDGIEYEAFNTSGGLGTLCETLAGKVESLDYKSVRYPGHRDLMKFLLDDLRMSTDRDGLKAILKRAVPSTRQDVVLVFVTVTGMRSESDGKGEGGQLVQDVFTRKIFAKEVCGVPMSAIQITTAGAVCAELDLFREGVLPQSGFVRQEQVPLDAFLNNRFGKLYEGANALTTTRRLAVA
ncbi:saccharopine dehydrogenase C-terminal domain-containing protein [Caballeronia sp. Lep1P3]|uniref:saccharopine dehydrogenase C-terminal domain-containing protein n=1 Tax=Caballeronia sp. Lep1P3 TaxID=2878150 RepID=UPI001FD19B31|nr:saccharopine dehydrogenase C-terminal domain-containing protein [Caballeronia sp. Lep1P3]